MNTKIVFFAGKGGVGKSTLAAAFALNAAKNQQKTLIVSIDPAHNLSDLFCKKMGKHIVRLDKRLYGLEVNAAEASEKYIQTVKNNLTPLVDAELTPEIERHLNLAKLSPGSEESALLDSITTIILEQYPHYDKIIFDMAPTGHAIRLLSLPELLDTWITQMIQKRCEVTQLAAQWSSETPISNDDDPIYHILTQRKDRFQRIREILLDSDQTCYYFVLIPERLSILETEKAVKLLKTFGITINELLVNKILPDHVESQFFQNRKSQQQHYIETIHSKFKKQRITHIPLFDTDIYNRETLHALCHYF